MYEPRFYRDMMGERFASFVFRHKETDIWMAVDRESRVQLESIKNFAADKCRSLRQTFENYFLIDPDFKSSLIPREAKSDMPPEILRLSKASAISGVGPMAGIAGLFAEEIGRSCKERFALKNIIVENGGDVYLDVNAALTLRIFAGDHPLSNKINLQIDEQYCPLGLCASSGKFGHSKSFGSADLVSLACRDTVLADQYATAFANRVHGTDDIEKVLQTAMEIPEILHLAVYKDDRFGMGGKIKVITA